MPQSATGGYDFSGVFPDAPKAPKGQAPSAPAGDFDFSGVFPDGSPEPVNPDSMSDLERLVLGLPPKQDTRSSFAQGWDTATTPLVSSERARRISGRMAGRTGGEPLPEITGGVLDAFSPTALLETASGFLRHPIDTTRAAAGGAVEGLAQAFSSPLDLALLAAGPLARGARGLITTARAAVQQAERALLAARMAGRTDEIADLSRQLEVARQEAGRASAAAGALRGVERGAAAGMTARGAERIISDDHPGDVPAGAAEALMGLVGVKMAAPSKVAQPAARGEVRGALRGDVRPSYVVTPEGVAGSPEAIPMQRAPDGSFVRAEPGEYARHEVRGLLTEPSGYVSTPDGVAVPISQAGSIRQPAAAPPAPDPSYVRGERGQYARHEIRGELPAGPGFIASESQVAPLARAGELLGRPSLRQAVDALTALPAPVSGKGKRPKASTPAAVSDFKASGGRIYSSDPAAVSVRNVPLDDSERSEVRRMLAEMEAMPFTPHTFLRDEARSRNIGGSPEVLGGAGGARVYQDILELHGGNPSRGDVIGALQKTLSGEPSTYGPAIRQTARERLLGHRRAQLPPEAGDLSIEPGRMSEDDFNAFDDYVNRLSREESSEAGKVPAGLATRIGAGVAGGVAGAATGETPEERVTRGAAGFGAGLIAPSLLRRGPGGTVLRGAPSTARVAARTVGGSVQPVSPTRVMPPAQQIPKARLLEFPSIQKMPEETRGDIADLLEKHGGFVEQRRGVQPVGRTEAKADRIELPLERLKPGTIVNAEELAAYKNAVASVMTKRHPLLEKIQGGNATDIEKLEFSRLTDTATVLVANYRGLKAETGRALNILRSKARVLDYGDQAFIEAAIKAPGFDRDIKEIAQAAVEAGGDPLKQLEWLRGRTAGTKFELAQAAWYNSLLSGVKTHLRNTIGNSFNAVWNLAVPIAAAPVDALRSKVTGREREVFFGELGPSIAGAFSGIPQGYRNLVFTLQHGFTPKAVQRAGEGIFDTPRAELPGGILTNLPSRLLEGMDAAFREVAYREELFGGAWAQARKEGLARPEAIKARMAELIAGESAQSRQLHERTEKFAARAVFQETPGVIGQSLLKIKNSPKSPMAVKAAATFVFPFVRTTGNILRQGAEATPMALGMSAVRQPGREGSQAVGRMVLGTAALTPLAYLAATGRLTGAPPSDAGERTAFYESGKRPNSVKIGDKWVSYQLFQPLSVGLAAIANGWQRFMESDRSDKAAEESMMSAVAGVGASFLDQSFLAGLNGLIDAVNDPERNAARFLSTMSQSAVPASGMMRNVTQAVDPVIRKPEGVAESMKAIIPGLSSSVPARLGRFGQEVRRPGNAVQRGFLVPEVSKETSDRVSRMLDRLGVTPQVPRSDIRVRGEVVKLTRDQEHAVVQARGMERRRRLEVLMRRPAFANIPEPRQRELVEAEISRASRTVTERAQSLLRRRDALTLEALMPSTVAAR